MAKRSFKEYVGNKFNAGKEKAKSTANKVKTKARNYGSTLKSSYKLGYRVGYGVGKDVPSAFGASFATACGFKSGVSDYKNSEAIKKRLNGVNYVKQ